LTIRNVKRLHQIACECFDAVSVATNGGGLVDRAALKAVKS